jgi:hypothetical protein
MSATPRVKISPTTFFVVSLMVSYIISITAFYTLKNYTAMKPVSLYWFMATLMMIFYSVNLLRNARIYQESTGDRSFSLKTYGMHLILTTSSPLMFTFGCVGTIVKLSPWTMLAITGISTIVFIALTYMVEMCIDDIERSLAGEDEVEDNVDEFYGLQEIETPTNQNADSLPEIRVEDIDDQESTKEFLQRSGVHKVILDNDAIVTIVDTKVVNDTDNTCQCDQRFSVSEDEELKQDK